MKLTKNDIDLLANRARDILKEQHEKQYKSIRESEEYVNFERTFDDSVTSEIKLLIEKYQEVKEKLDAVNKLKDEIVAQVSNLSESLDVKQTFTYSSTKYPYKDPSELLKGYLEKAKQLKFPNAVFDETVMLNKLKTDIMLSAGKNHAEVLSNVLEING